MNEKVFETIEGYKLIGIETTPPDDFYEKQFGMPAILAKQIFKGIWIHRTRINKVTFIGEDDLVRIRPLTIFDTEYDPPQGLE